MSSEKKWIVLLATTISLWALVLASTLYPWLAQIEILVDTSVNLTLFTAPLLAFNLVYVVMMIFVYLAYLGTAKNVEKRQLQIKERSQPDGVCSIIIPARNEESVIRRTILNCLQQTYQNIEVIVVCHNCSDRTFQEAQVDDPRVKAYELTTEEAGKGIALNYGVERSEGGYLLILDGDGLLTRDFIELALPFVVDEYAAVQGRYVPSNRNYNLVTRMLALEGDLWSTPFMSIRSYFGNRTALGGTGYIVRKDVLAKIGMFANHLVDDYELTFRLLRNGYKIGFAPLSINYDEKPPTVAAMIRQRARWGKGFIDLLSTRVATKSDIIGNIYWLNPIAALTGLVMLLVPAYAALHFLVFGYYPYTYTYIPLYVWLGLSALLLILQTSILVKQYGRKGIWYALQLTLLVPFSHYWFVTFLKAFSVKSWANTKTAHGFAEMKGSEKVAADVA